MFTHPVGFEWLTQGLLIAIPFAFGAIAVLWGVLYLMDRVFPEVKSEGASKLRLVEPKVETLDDEENYDEHRKAA